MIYAVMKVIFKIFFRVLFRARVQGQENIPLEGPLILAANHMSNWDPPLLGTFCTRTVSYMAKEELFHNPVFGGIITRMHAFPVHRGKGDAGAFKAAIGILKQNHCLGLFPEGTRSKDGKIHKAEAGVAMIAAMTGAPVLPAAIVGTNRMFSSGCLFPQLRLVYGKPMHFTGNRKNKEELTAFSQQIMDEVARLQTQ